MERVEELLKGIARCGRVAGAYLFLGPPGVGKKRTAEVFSEELRCAKQDKFLISPSTKSLGIDQIRELQKWVRYGPSASQYLAAIVEGADTLTGEAAAAFLKTLEEPAPGVVFVLLAEREDRMPETIVSRCQRIIFSEKSRGWEEDGANKDFYKELRSISQKETLDLLKLSAKLEKEKERIEELLYDLAFFARHELFDARLARILLEGLRFLKRKANLKLALDVMCLRLGKVAALSGENGNE